jgi:hypothetical protein
MWNGLPGGLDRLWRVADAIEKLVPTSPRHKWRFGSFSSLLLLFISLTGHWLKGVFLFLRERSCIRRKRRTLRVSSPGNEDTRPVFASDVPKDLKTRNTAKKFSCAIYGVEK